MWVVSHLAGCGVSSTAAFTSWVCDKSYLIILLLILLSYDQVLIFLQRWKCRGRCNCSARSPFIRLRDSSTLGWWLSSNSK
jgi:hypothetical protein